MGRHPYFFHQLMPQIERIGSTNQSSNIMRNNSSSSSSSSSSVSLKFYFFCGIVLIYAMCSSSLCAGRPIEKSTERHSQQTLEEIYWKMPAVPDERLADAEHDNAHDLFNQRPKTMTSKRNQNL